MKFIETPLAGAYVIKPEQLEDERGFFARVFCSQEFKNRGLETHWVQSSISWNKTKGTLRGMHYQANPHAETKLIRCTMGAIYDVIIDLRPSSQTYKQWFAVELSQQNRQMLYVPTNFAHGFQTLTDDTEVFYQISEFYTPSHARTIQWNDPTFAIDWPEESCRIISEQDRRGNP